MKKEGGGGTGMRAERHFLTKCFFFNVMQCNIYIFYAMCFLICLQIKNMFRFTNYKINFFSLKISRSELTVLCSVNYLFIGRDNN